MLLSSFIWIKLMACHNQQLVLRYLKHVIIPVVFLLFFCPERCGQKLERGLACSRVHLDAP